MGRDAFSDCHPAVNFVFFVGAIGFGAVIQHPAYAAAGVVCAALYYLLLRGRAGLKLFGFLAAMFLVISLVNPLLNTSGGYVLQYIFGRPYTLEALCYGMALGALFVVMLLWFGCYSQVLTSDKFTALFGNLIPALSLLLVMVLRLIPSFTRKAAQIAGARRAIGKGSAPGAPVKERVRGGMGVLSALTDWALEGGIVTADSMRARGYGAAKRTRFRIYRMTARDWTLLGLILALELAVLLAGGTGAVYTPRIRVDGLTWGFGAYCLLLLLPSLLQGKETIAWRISRSRI